MIVKKNVRKWLDRFKPEVRFVKKEKDNTTTEYIVTKESKLRLKKGINLRFTYWILTNCVVPGKYYCQQVIYDYVDPDLFQGSIKILC